MIIKKDDIKKEKTMDEYLDMVNSCSSGDCTGLIPEGSPDPNSSEGKSYDEVYSYVPKPFDEHK